MSTHEKEALSPLDLDLLASLKANDYGNVGDLDSRIAKEYGVPKSAASKRRRELQELADGYEVPESGLDPSDVKDGLDVGLQVGVAPESSTPRIDPDDVAPPATPAGPKPMVFPRLRLEAQPTSIDQITLRPGGRDCLIAVTCSFEDDPKSEQGYHRLPMSAEELDSKLMSSRKLESGAKNTSSTSLKRSWPTLNLFFAFEPTEEDALPSGSLEVQMALGGDSVNVRLVDGEYTMKATFKGKLTRAQRELLGRYSEMEGDLFLTVDDRQQELFN